MAIASLQLGDCNPQSPAGAGGRAVKALRTEQVLEELAMQSARIMRLEKRINELDVQLAASKGREMNLARRVADLEAVAPVVELTKAIPNEQEQQPAEIGANSLTASVQTTSGVTPDTLPSFPLVEDCIPVETKLSEKQVEDVLRYRGRLEGSKLGYHEILELVEGAPDFVRADRKFMLEAVAECGSALKYAADYLKSDRDVVHAAVKQNGEALQWASGILKADREVVLAAVKQNCAAVKFASDSLREDKDLHSLSMKTKGEVP